MQSLPAYLRLVSMVMSYSFTDGAASCSLSRTMMVPFVDLLNHHSRHHVELEFTKTSLHLMVVRDIKKVCVSSSVDLDGILLYFHKKLSHRQPLSLSLSLSLSPPPHTSGSFIVTIAVCIKFCDS